MKKYMKPVFAAVAVSLLLIGCSEAKNEEKGAVINEVKEEIKESISNEVQTGNRDSLIQAVDIANALLERKYDHLYEQFDEYMKDIVSLQDFKSIGEQFIEGVDSFELSSTVNVNGFNSYVWKDNTKQKAINASVNEQNQIIGLQVLQLTSYPETDEMYSQTMFQPPFANEWLVYWGGKNVFENYHYEYEHVRYAYDFVIMKDGYTYSGDPLNNESYYAFGAEVLAPADGEVIAVVDGIADNIPGEMNEQQAEGNMVVIQHDHGEVSMLAHFKQNSITVKVGDKVKQGQVLGLCGNSGNSSEAHIHFQVMKQVEDDSDLVIPITFASGKEWVRGDLVQGQKL